MINTYILAEKSEGKRLHDDVPVERLENNINFTQEI
jgi:hypothetical protein